MLRKPNSFIAGMLLSVLVLSGCQTPKVQKTRTSKGDCSMISNQVEVRLSVEVVVAMFTHNYNSLTIREIPFSSKSGMVVSTA